MKTFTRKLKIFIGVLVILACAMTAGMYVINTHPESTRQIAKIDQSTQHLTEPVTEVPDGYTAIRTPNDLNNIRNDLAGNYILMNDIDMSTFGNFEPIGDATTPFTGILDGNCYVISGLTINSDSDYVGLFGCIEGATIENIGLENITVIGKGDVGSLVGYIKIGTVSNVYATGTVTGLGEAQNSWVGGLIGDNRGTITNVCLSLTVTSLTHAGGLSGFNYGTITNSYVIGSVIGTEDNVGAINAGGYGSITNTYWTPELSGLDYVVSENQSVIRLDNIAKQSTYEGFDFENIWGIDEENSLPYLKWADERKITKAEITSRVDRTSFPTYEGEGTIDNPYLIKTEQDLQDVEKKNLEGKYYYKLANDIDMEEVENFKPIGSAIPFDGHFDGNNKVIRNLNIETERNYVGLFGCVEEGTIENIGLENITISGKNRVGGIAGSVKKSKISNMYLNGTVEGNSVVGGLLGSSASSTVTNAIVEGNVSGNSTIGGVCGQRNGSYPSELNLYNVLVLIHVDSNNDRPYAIIADSYQWISGYGCYWVPEFAGIDFVLGAKGTPIRADDIAQQSIYSGFDFENIWEIDEGNSAPYLKWSQRSKITKEEIMNQIDRSNFPTYDGEGTIDNPYLIKTAQDLQDIEKKNLEGKYYYKLANNIDMDGVENFKPIGSTIPFEGHFDGNNKVISNLKIESDRNYVGLFGYVDKGTIENMELLNEEISGKNCVGGLAGIMRYCTVNNVYVTGEIKGSDKRWDEACDKNSTGGIAGYAEESLLKYVQTKCVVEGYENVGGLLGKSVRSKIERSSCVDSIIFGRSNYVGGMCGYSSNGSLEYVFVEAEVSGLNYVGGLIGDVYTNTIVNQAYTEGCVTGNNYVGGILGIYSGLEKVNYLYSRAKISGNGECVGGLIGLNNHDTVKNSYWSPELAEITEADSTVAGTAVTAEQMKHESTFVGWDFDSVWGIIEEGINYPEFNTATIKLYAAGTTTPLSGAQFAVYDSSNNNVLGQNTYYTTDTRGKVVFSVKDMPAGIYTFEEITPSTGYVRDINTYTFTIAKDKSVVFGESATTGVIYNKKLAPAGQASGTLTKLKRLGGQDTTTVVPGAVIGVYEEDKTTKIDELTTDAQGQVDFGASQKLEALTTYYYKEEQAPAGYIKDEAWKQIVVDADGNISLLEGNILYNDRVTAPVGSVVILKIDSNTNSPLENAEIGLCDKNGNIITNAEGQELKYMTNENGQIDFSANVLLEPGTYYYREVTPPVGYAQDNNVYQFTVSNDGTVTFNEEPSGIIYNDKELYLKSTEYLIGTKPAGYTKGDLTEYKTGDKYISKVDPHTTLADFINNLDTNGTPVVTKPDGTPLGPNEWVGTEMILTVTKGNKQIEITIVVTGDVSGDGDVTLQDFSVARQLQVKELAKEDLTTPELLAIDFDDDEDISLSDFSEELGLYYEYL